MAVIHLEEIGKGEIPLSFSSPASEHFHYFLSGALSERSFILRNLCGDSFAQDAETFFKHPVLAQSGLALFVYSKKPIPGTTREDSDEVPKNYLITRYTLGQLRHPETIFVEQDKEDGETVRNRARMFALAYARRIMEGDSRYGLSVADDNMARNFLMVTSPLARELSGEFLKFPFQRSLSMEDVKVMSPKQLSEFYSYLSSKN